MVELSAQNVVMDSFLDTQSRSNSLQWFTHVYAYLAQYGQRVSLNHENNNKKKRHRHACMAPTNSTRCYLLVFSLLL